LVAVGTLNDHSRKPKCAGLICSSRYVDVAGSVVAIVLVGIVQMIAIHRSDVAGGDIQLNRSRGDCDVDEKIVKWPIAEPRTVNGYLSSYKDDLKYIHRLSKRAYRTRPWYQELLPARGVRYNMDGEMDSRVSERRKGPYLRLSCELRVRALRYIVRERTGVYPGTVRRGHAARAL
jgi:hypothetical protein